jgi:DNA polymerase III subunit gamma/tau
LALDTKYRPTTYNDVLGQESHVAVLRQFVKEGRGFQQSYVFCGQHGSGKTTTARILVRALLCDDPVNGDPCDECHSCRTLLDGRTHENFEELDAASKSKKEDLARIVDEIRYSSFSGKRKIYLFDESHQLSKQALDILLKPMEDSIEGTQDKKLVCIFATTEPERMRSTIFSRCAPAFVIRAVTPEKIAERLAWVCQQEGIQYEQEALVTIAEISESHIRDALKSVEGVSMLGSVTKETVSQYMRLGANDLALDILENLASDLQKATTIATQMAHEVSPASAYERLAEAAMCAYRESLGVGKIPSHWKPDRIRNISKMGPTLLGIAARFAAPPHRVNRHTLLMDVGSIHFALRGKLGVQGMSQVVLGVTSPAPAGTGIAEEPDEPEPEPETFEEPTVQGGVFIDPRGVGPGPSHTQREEPEIPLPEPRSAKTGKMRPALFRNMVQFYLSSG